MVAAMEKKKLDEGKGEWECQEWVVQLKWSVQGRFHWEGYISVGSKEMQE